MNYPAKLLLFGEYTVLRGSEALAIPIRNFSGKWAFLNPNESQNIVSLQPIADYLGIAEFQKEVAEGLFFESDIPQGYGAGSSGALVAAIYDRYIHKKEEKENTNIAALQAELGKMEGFFHGSSSGLDPLVSYLQQPILLSPEKPPTVLEKKYPLDIFFLIDTKISRKTSDFVAIFKQKCQDKHFTGRLDADLLPLVQDAISGQNLRSVMHEISWFQYRFFSEMIPTAFREMWLQGLETGNYSLKLCGAGGGGFLLGIRNDELEMNNHQIIKINS